MAHSNNSVITGKLQGSLGKELVFRNWEGKTVVAKAPGRRTKPATEEQEKAREVFQMASRFAKAIVSGVDPSLAEAYTAVLKPRQNLYCRAMEDFMSAPKVVDINARFYKGQTGDQLIVKAKDDFRVVSVRLEIYAADGSLLESGEAVSDIYDLNWTYTATTDNNTLPGTVIKAFAFDVPGNEGMLELVL